MSAVVISTRLRKRGCIATVPLQREQCPFIEAPHLASFIDNTRFSLRCAISATPIENQLTHELSCVDHLINVAPWTLAVEQLWRPRLRSVPADDQQSKD
jgi:hypothetical protein